MGEVRMMRTSSLSMRTFRPIAVGILGSEFEQRRLVAELDLLAGLIHVHDLVDDLEQRLVVVNLAVMHFLCLPQPRSSRTLAAATRAIGGQFGSIMIPASVLMAVSVYDRASDAICPRFFGMFRSSCFVSIRHNPHRRWQTIKSKPSRAEGGLRVGRAFIEIIVHFIDRGACHVAPWLPGADAPSPHLADIQHPAVRGTGVTEYPAALTAA